MGHTRGPSRKGKEVAADQGDDPTPPVNKKQKRQQRREEEEEVEEASPPRPTPKTKPKKPTGQALLQRLNKMVMVPTKWADHELLRRLGIHEDVGAMFHNMGLEGLFNMSYTTYETQTRQLLSSVVFFDDTSKDMNDENRGQLTFKIGTREYSITLAQLGALFSFPTNGKVQVLGVDNYDGQRLWSVISVGGFAKGSSKGGKIRHPAIRYVHKFLANTLYAREEHGAIKEEEMALIIEGVKPYLKNEHNEDLLRGLPRPVSLAHVLANRFMFYKDYEATTPKEKAKIGIGGLITPILIACKVPLPRQTPPPPPLLDEAYLTSFYFLVGKLGEAYGYKYFICRDVDEIIILPKPNVTSIFQQGNISFNPPKPLLFDPLRDGQLTTIKASRSGPDYQRENEEYQRRETIMGSKRYDFELYRDPIGDKALRAAHEHIGLLKRLTKWQGKQIKKLVKTVKKQGKLIKKLIKGSPHRQDGEGTSMDIVRVAEPTPCVARPPLSPDSIGSGNMDYSMDSNSPLPSP